VRLHPPAKHPAEALENANGGIIGAVLLTAAAEIRGPPSSHLSEEEFRLTTRRAALIADFRDFSKQPTPLSGW
jgi:hypothetical protein